MGQQHLSFFRKRNTILCRIKANICKGCHPAKKELQQLLTDLEYLSVKGEFNNGNKLSIYLSNINFETTYSYISKKNFEVSLFSIYSLNSMDSQNPHICRMQKKWIQSLKRHSTQISESGETQRIAFLEKQKNIIAAL